MKTLIDKTIDYKPKTDNFICDNTLLTIRNLKRITKIIENFNLRVDKIIDEYFKNKPKIIMICRLSNYPNHYIVITEDFTTYDIEISFYNYKININITERFTDKTSGGINGRTNL